MLKKYIADILTHKECYYVFVEEPSEHFVVIINSKFVVFNLGKDFYYAKKQKIKDNGGFYFLIKTTEDFDFYLQHILNYDKEEWRDITCYNDLPYVYQISNKGNVYNKTRKVFLRTNMKQNGYLEVQLSKKHYCLVHRLVAQMFIDNPQQKPYVNHIDGDRSNNRVENLEWVTESENTEHYHTKLKTSSEKTIENKIKDYLFKKGHLYFKVHGSNFMTPGISDIIACICGRFVAIEVKAPGRKNTESEQQKIFGSNVIKSNGLYYLVDSLEEVVEIVEGIEQLEQRGACCEKRTDIKNT